MPDNENTATACFEAGRVAAAAGEYERAIEVYLEGLALAPDNVHGHRGLRDVSLLRKASGGRDLGVLAKARCRWRARDAIARLLCAESLLTFDPGNTDHMLVLLQSARRAGLLNTVQWIEQILHHASKG